MLLKLFISSLILLFPGFCSSIDNNKALDDLPAYFDRDTWEEINKQNSLSGVEEKIAVVIDGPVEYIGVLRDKKYGKRDEKIIDTVDVLSNIHGTAVAGLVVGDILELECISSASKLCPKKLIYVAGIARGSKLLNFPFYGNQKNNEYTFSRLEKKMEALNNKRAKSKVQRNLPAKIVLNFSVGVDELLQRYFENKKIKIAIGEIPTSDKNKEVKFYEWYLSYLKDKKNWVIPDIKLSDDWGNFKYEREKESKEITENINIEFSSLMSDSGLLSAVDKLVVVAAGNDGRKLPYEGEGFTARRIDDKKFDPVIRVGAVCDKGGNKIICEFSNYNGDLIDIVSPGSDISVMAFATSPNSSDKNFYATYMNGTSFSAPLTSGTLLLLAACKPTATIAELKSVLLESATNVKDLEQYVINGRVLNVRAALNTLCKQEVPLHAQAPDNEDENIKEIKNANEPNEDL